MGFMNAYRNINLCPFYSLNIFHLPRSISFFSYYLQQHLNVLKRYETQTTVNILQTLCRNYRTFRRCRFGDAFSVIKSKIYSFGGLLEYSYNCNKQFNYNTHNYF